MSTILLSLCLFLVVTLMVFMTNAILIPVIPVVVEDVVVTSVHGNVEVVILIVFLYFFCLRIKSQKLPLPYV